jgi:hypothetical protein
MSDAMGKKIKLWDGIIEYGDPVPDTRTKAVRADIEARLVEFDHHKEPLLNILRDAHNHSPKSEPFNEDKWWFHLGSLARIYSWQARVKQETMPVAEREARLRALAKALGNARGLTDKALQDDVGDDLFSAWWEETNEPPGSMVRNSDDSIALVPNADEKFREAVTGLAALEAAARQAVSEAHDKRTGRGRTGTVPPDCIDTLWLLYRDSTGMEPGAGHGPFVRFVCAFLAAIRANVSEDHVVDLAQKARSRAHTTPSKEGSSPFDD